MPVDTRWEDLQGPSKYYYWVAMDKNAPLVEPLHNHTATGHEPRAHTAPISQAATSRKNNHATEDGEACACL